MEVITSDNSSSGKQTTCITASWDKHSDIVVLFILMLVIWAIGFSLFDDDTVGVNSQLFTLAVLFITAKIAGCAVALIKLPPMVGMLLMGVFLRNTGFINIHGSYTKVTEVLRQMALVNIMLPAGLGLDPKALQKMSWMVLNLAIIPVATEVLGIAVASHYFINFPWLWGVLLGLSCQFKVTPRCCIPSSDYPMPI